MVILLLRILIALLVLAAIILLGGCAFGRRVLFPRHVIRVDRDALPPPGAEQWWIDSPKGKVEAWFLSGDQVSSKSPGPVVIFAHGNAELIDYWPLEMANYQRLGISVLLAEYRGYGRSAGKPSEAAITADFIQFYRILSERSDVDAARIVYHGRSVGGGAVTSLAATHPPAALILQSAFTDVRSVARHHGLPAFLVRDRFDSLAVVGNLDCPILIMHGRHDQIIPFAHGEALYEPAPNSRIVAYDCGHNDPMPSPLYWEDICGFLVEAGIVEEGV